MKRKGVSGERKRAREVEDALYRRAVGFEQREEKTVSEEDGKGGLKEKRETTVKQAGPDLNAILAYLRERVPERWKGAQGNADGEPVIRVVSNIPRPDAPSGEGGPSDSNG